MRNIYLQYKDILSYLFFGVCTTLVNIVCYYVCVRWLGLSTIEGTVVAWILAVLFAFVTNKQFVFKSFSWEKRILLQEATSFFLYRALTGILDIVVMFVGVELFGLFDVGVKAFSNIIVIILNYIASNCMVFRKKSVK